MRKQYKKCVCGGDIIKPLKMLKLWICLRCKVGSIRTNNHKPIYLYPEDAQKLFRDEILIEDLLTQEREQE